MRIIRAGDMIPADRRPTAAAVVRSIKYKVHYYAKAGKNNLEAI